jgi:PAT family beta-lactamase induction signal transducer AmpG
MSGQPSIARTLFSGRMLVMLATGFSSGLPLLLTGSTLQAWLTDEKIDLRAIGLFALVGLPYTLKFLWSPFLDRYVPRFLGRRRGWMLVIQLLLAIAILSLGTLHPAQHPWLVAALAVGVTFFSASQDVVLDAYRREALPDRELGLGTSIFISGYRLGMLVAGALALAFADRMPWRSVYLIMALCMVAGIVTTLICPEPKVEAPPPRSLQEAVVEPFLEFFRRPEALWILAFILFYKLGDQMASALTTPFVLALGFTKTELAALAKVFGMGAMIAGGIVGGVLMLRLGIKRSLWLFGFAQVAGILTFAGLASAGKVYWLLATTIVAENFAFGMGGAAYAAYMASATNKRFTATQYALFSSVVGVVRVFTAAPSGYIATMLGWTGYFVFCAVAAIPGLVLLLRVAPWHARDDNGTGS